MLARTPRLLLRPGLPEDAIEVARAIAYDAVTHRLEHVPSPYTITDAQAWLALPPEPGGVTMIVLSRDNTERAMIGHSIIGAVSLLPREGELMLGYWYTPSAWGRGYATEAGRAAVTIARYTMRIRRLCSRYHVDNPASGNVLRKLGFRPTAGRPSTHSLARGHSVDSIAMALDFADLPAA